MSEILAIIGLFVMLWIVFVLLTYVLSQMFKNDGWGIAAALSVLFTFFSYLFVSVFQ